MADPTAMEIGERIWNGELTTDVGAEHPVQFRSGALEPVVDGVAFLWQLGNGSVHDTGSGLFLVDGNRGIRRHVREWSDAPVRIAVYSHGHVDHVFGAMAFDEEDERPTVIAHEALPARLDRYKLTAGYNGVINMRQFQLEAPLFPTEFRYPDETYSERRDVDVGGMRFELHHARGETDDHTWTWCPDRNVLCTGDLFIWGVPNCGNPQKVQRYPREWAAALREMIALGAEVMLPGHGYPLVGSDRIRTALSDTAALLESLVAQSLDLMNAGARLDDLIHTVRVPDELAAKPWLQPVYDEPEFIVRNVWRLYGGWHDGNPANLKPARETVLAAELASLAGGAARLAARAAELSAAGEHRLACHLAELAALADPAQHDTRASVYEARVSVERSTMAKGVYAWAARESREAR